MASVEVTYTWPAGGTLAINVKAKARNVEALADMRIEAERLWAKGLVKVDAEPEHDGTPSL